MKRIDKIALKDLFDSQISGRSAVDAIFSSLEGTNHLVLDFSSITFISRSAAHQLVSTCDQLQKNRITVEMQSLHPDVSQMIAKVRNSIQRPVKLATYVEFLSFPTEKEMEDFVLSF